jgi:hypothetical protein
MVVRAQIDFLCIIICLLMSIIMSNISIIIDIILNFSLPQQYRLKLPVAVTSLSSCNSAQLL